jgi:hypothetical protein
VVLSFLKVFFSVLNIVHLENDALSIETCWSVWKKREYWTLVRVYRVGCFIHIIVCKYVNGMDNVKKKKRERVREGERDFGKSTGHSAASKLSVGAVCRCLRIGANARTRFLP